MRRSLLFASCAAAAIAAACGPSSETAQQEADSQVTEITAAGTAFPNTAGELQWFRFQRRVEEGTGGRIKVRMLVHGQLGSEEQIVSGLQRNRVHIGNLSAMVASTIVPETAVLYAPFLFESEAEADFVYDNFLTDLFSSLVREHGLHLVTWDEIGFHHIYSVTPILSPEDLRGRRFRVSASEASRQFARAFGADVIPLGFGEIVPSLQTGLIEAGENSVSLYVRTGTSAEAPHLTLTGHSFGMSLIVASKTWWDGMSEADRRVVAGAYPTIEESRLSTRAEANQDLENAADFGIVPRWPDAAEREAWAAAVSHIPGELAQTIGGQADLVLETIAEGKAAFALQQAAGPVLRPAADRAQAADGQLSVPAAPGTSSGRSSSTGSAGAGVSPAGSGSRRLYQRNRCR